VWDNGARGWCQSHEHHWYQSQTDTILALTWLYIVFSAKQIYIAVFWSKL
jgi:hypothetical protein